MFGRSSPLAVRTKSASGSAPGDWARDAAANDGPWRGCTLIPALAAGVTADARVPIRQSRMHRHDARLGSSRGF